MGATGPAGSANISGTTNTIIKFTGPTTGGNSIMTDNGSTVTTNGLFTINSAPNGAGNLQFTAANPVVVSSSYMIVPGGAYFNSGTVYFEAQAQLRGGIHNDAGPYLRVDGGTSGITYYPGSIGVGTAGPAEQVHATGNIRADGIVYWGNGLTRTETKDNANAPGSRSGFFETSAPGSGWYPNASSWQHLIDVRHSNGGNNYAFQIGGGFFDEDLWYRKTNGDGNTTWLQLLGAGPRQCTAPFNSAGVVTTTSAGGTTRSNTICATTWFNGTTFNEAQNVCFALGGHISTYNELYRLSQTYGTGSVLFNGDWIGNRAGDDQAYCVNGTNIANFEGVCNKNDSRIYRCVNSSNYNE